MRPSPSVLLVGPRGPERAVLARVLARGGLEVRAAAEPYEATLAFVERPADVVLLSLRRWRPRDRGFLRALRRRHRDVRVAVLSPEGRRGRVREALAAGADAWLPEPCFPEEALRLVRALAPGARPPDDRALRALAAEVAHAVNNPLQVIALTAETAKLAPTARERVVEHVGRIRTAVALLNAYATLGPAQRRVADPAGPAAAAARAAADDGLASVAAPPVEGRVRVAMDAGQVEAAVGVMIRVLAAHADTTPIPIRVTVRRTPRGGAWVRVNGRGALLDPDRFEALRTQVLWSRDDRALGPGLALPVRVAAAHGGRLGHRGVRGGHLLELRLPRG